MNTSDPFAEKYQELRHALAELPSLHDRLQAVHDFHVAACVSTVLPGGMANELLEALEEREQLRLQLAALMAWNDAITKRAIAKLQWDRARDDGKPDVDERYAAYCRADENLSDAYAEWSRVKP